MQCTEMHHTMCTTRYNLANKHVMMLTSRTEKMKEGVAVM